MYRCTGNADRTSNRELQTSEYFRREGIENDGPIDSAKTWWKPYTSCYFILVEEKYNIRITRHLNILIKLLYIYALTDQNQNKLS